MKRQVINVITLCIFTLIVFLTVSANGHAGEEHYGKMNMTSLNNGSMQLKGITWCRSHFDGCVIRENYTAGILQSREVIKPDQFVVMQTGIENPQIVSVEADTNRRHRIIFVYDQNRVHTPWIPEYIK